MPGLALMMAFFVDFFALFSILFWGHHPKYSRSPAATQILTCFVRGCFSIRSHRSLWTFSFTFSSFKKACPAQIKVIATKDGQQSSQERATKRGWTDCDWSASQVEMFHQASGILQERSSQKNESKKKHLVCNQPGIVYNLDYIVCKRKGNLFI